MEPPKRIAHKNAVITNLLRANAPKIIPVQAPKNCSVCTQTEEINFNNLDNVTQTTEFARPKTTLVQQQQQQQQQQKWKESNVEPPSADANKRSSRNKACQTQNVGLKRVVSDSQTDSMKARMLKRRKMAIEVDRARLKKLLDEINSDPPPSWHKASLMWLDVDVLERRIEEFEQKEADTKGSTEERK